MCMTRMEDMPKGSPISSTDAGISVIKDLVTDVSVNYQLKRRLRNSKPRQPDAPDGTWRMARVTLTGQEFRKCIECFLCQDVCHVLENIGS